MLTLPNDVLLLVGDYLEDPQDCLNLIFVCQRFHDLYLRVLYRSADLKSCVQTQSFLRGLLRRPELARVVRSVAFDNWQPRSLSSSPTYSYSHSLHDDLEPFTQWARSISHSEAEHIQWEQDLLNGVEEAWIALLLPLVSNVRQLRLIYPKNNRYLDRTLQRAMNGEKPFHAQPAFHTLQEVSLGHLDDGEDTKGSYLPSQIISFFRLPSMRVFSAGSVIEPGPAPKDGQQQQEGGEGEGGIEERTIPEGPVTQGHSQISEITLNSSNGSQGMASLIASCSSLRSFKYQHSDNHALAEGYQPLAFQRSLAGSKTSLQTLWLDNCGEHLPFTSTGLNETHDEWFGPLTEFTALKDLRIRLPNLLDVRYQPEPSLPLTEVLPRSVESLYVEGCRENSLGMLLRQLETVVRERQKRFSGLRSLDIEGFFHKDEEDEERGSGSSEETGSGGQRERVIKPQVYAMAESLGKMCVDAGIQLHLRDRVCLQTMG